MNKVLPNAALKIAIFRAGISQRELAFDTRIDEGRLSRIIRGYEKPNDEIQNKIASYLKMKREDLFIQ